MKPFLLFLCLVYSASAQASLWDDLMSFISGDDEAEQAEPASSPTEDATAKPEPTEAGMVETMGAAASLLSDTAQKGLLPTVSERLGVTEAQARGGLGALFSAAKTVLSEEDFAMVAGAVPGMDGLMAEAPPTNELLGSALQLGGIGGSGTAAANLLTQFNSLGLDADMIMKYGEVTRDYLSDSAPEASDKLMQAVSGLR